MRLENGSVYGNGRGSYMLVFNTTNFGAAFAYCNTDSHVQNVYANIPELKIDDTVGTVCIDRIIYVPWTKMSTTNYELYKKLSRRQYILIINAISALYLGDIVIEDTSFEYIDKIPFKESLNNPKDEYKNGTERPTASMVEEKTREDKTATIIIEQKDNSINFEVPNSELIRKAKEAGIPIYTGPDTKPGEQFFDLIPIQTAVSSNSGGSTSSKSNYRAPAKARRHLFSETECITIACSSIAMISEKYDVSKSDAATMLRNAKKLFGADEHTPRTKPEITVKEIYESGMSLKDAIFKYRNIPADRIRRYYQDMQVEKDDKAAIVKWDVIMTSSIASTSNMKLIIDAARSDVNEFHINERCSLATAESILGKINRILAFNPLYVVFGDRAYEEDLQDTFTNGRACSKNVIDSYIYTITMRLSDPYKVSYNNHYDILHGTKPIPEGVMDDDKEFFLSMLYNHYNPRMILGKSRHLTRTQKDALESRDAEKVARAFAVQASRARSLINSYKIRQKRESSK